jgi:hypothetical protein
MSSLYQLPSGTWIDPDAVTGIKAAGPVYPDESPGLREPIGPRVIVRYLDGSIDICPVETPDEAAEVRDRIAAEVNARRRS